MNANYFFIDGSALTAQIRQLQRAEPAFRHRKLCPRKFIAHFVLNLQGLHGGSYKRATFYFPRGDEVAIEQFIAVPDRTIPGEVADLNFKFCGHKLKKSAEFAKFVDEVVPQEYLERFQKSEKGVDTEICCDALRLASTGRLERLFLLTNDSDFLPLCRTLKEFGANVSILHLSPRTNPNNDLLHEADTYNVATNEALAHIFLPPEAAQTEEEESAEDVAVGISAQPNDDVSEKPEAAPSDLMRLAEPEVAEEGLGETDPDRDKGAG